MYVTVILWQTRINTSVMLQLRKAFDGVLIVSKSSSLEKQEGD